MVAVSTEMDSVKRRLIDELEYNAQHGEKAAEVRLAETAAWFFSNKDRIPLDNFASRAEFLFKACWMLIETNALLLERIHEIEGGKSSLWLPSGTKMSGDVKKFG